VTEILLDAKCLQVVQHFQPLFSSQPVRRLTSFLKIIGSYGAIKYIDADVIDAASLGSANLFISTTRIQQWPYKDEEINSIHDFVASGGSLLLMSNHSRYPSSPSAGHHTEQDGRLARAFQI
jgi:hypothetical protein